MITLGTRLTVGPKRVASVKKYLTPSGALLSLKATEMGIVKRGHGWVLQLGLHPSFLEYSFL